MRTRKVRVIASGSSGNSTFIRLGETRLLVDAGVSLTRIRDALEEIGESLDDLGAVVITHEHGDHVSGLEPLLRAVPELPVLATSGTLRAMKARGLDARRLKAGKPKHWGGLDLLPFTVSHDAEEPIGLRIEASSFAMAIATDLGFWTDEVAAAMHGCPLVIVEANHDPAMLERGPYPRFLKRRVAGRKGHLANSQARALLDRIADPCIEQVVLAHMSLKNNTAELAYRAAAEVLGDEVDIVVATKDHPTKLLEPSGDAVFDGPPRQLALF